MLISLTSSRRPTQSRPRIPNPVGLREGRRTREAGRGPRLSARITWKWRSSFQPCCLFRTINDRNFCSLAFLSLSTIFIFNCALRWKMETLFQLLWSHTRGAVEGKNPIIGSQDPFPLRWTASCPRNPPKAVAVAEDEGLGEEAMSNVHKPSLIVSSRRGNDEPWNNF